MKTIASKSPFFIICIIFIASAPLFAQEASLAEEKEIKNVLVVNSYHSGYEWSDGIMKGIQSVLGDNNFNVHIEYLDSKKYDGEIYYKHLKEILRYKYSDAKIDAMIVSDHHAYNLMLEMRKTFQSDTPLIFCGLDRVYPENIADYQPIYGVVEGDGGIRSTLDLILSIHPGIHKIFFIADETTSAEVMLSYVRDFEPLYKEVTFDYLINMSAGELKAALKNVPQNSAVMWLHFIKDKNGKVFSVAESRKYVVNNVSVPVYVVSGFNTDTGVFGGSINSGFVQGEKAAQIVLELLNKNIIPDPFYQQVSSINIFDYKVMKRFNISIKDVPEDSIVYNKPFSKYAEYRWQIIGIIIFIFFQTLLISILLINLKKRKSGEKSLRKSEERFRATFEQAAVGIAHVAIDGRFLRINKKFCDIVGYSKEEMITKTFKEITYSEDLEADLEQTKQLLAGDINTYSMDKRYIRKDGSLVWINLTVSLIRDETDRPQWFVSAIKDISNRKHAALALQDSEEKFRSLMKQSPLSMQILNLDGQIIQVNEAWQKLWGISEEDLPEVLEKYNVLEDEEARKLGVMPLIEKAFKGEVVTLPVIEYDASSTMKNLEIDHGRASKRWIQARLYPVRNSKGEVVNVVDIEEDITERKQAEEKLQTYQQRLKAMASQLIIVEEQERRRIAADLHDNIGHSLSLARMQLKEILETQSELEKNLLVKDISNILLQTMRDTRGLIFELSSPSMNEIGLTAAISEWLEERIAKRYDLEIEFIDDIRDDRRKTLDENVRALLFRNVRELITNVVKHARADKMLVHITENDARVKIVVEDDGVGFDLDTGATKNKQDNGFGLFSIQERMTDLDGSFDIQSEPGKGCRVVLTVPVVR